MKIRTAALVVATLLTGMLVFSGCAGARTRTIEATLESDGKRIVVLEETTDVIASLFIAAFDDMRRIKRDFAEYKKLHDAKCRHRGKGRRP